MTTSLRGISGWHPYGPDAVLIEFHDPDDRWLVECPLAVESVVGACTVLLRFDAARHRVGDVVAAATLASRHPTSGREHVIPVRYDGPDLAEVAHRAQISVVELVQRHLASRFRAEFCGFAPGFAYLSGLDPSLYSPRRSDPRTRVPRGAVAIADQYCAVYPTDSPGGWQLLGTTDFALFDPRLDPPSLIRPGDTVRFREQP